MSDELRLHPRHLRQSRICMKNSRIWFAKRGWSWADFVAEGRPIQDFIDTGDPLALQAVETAKREAEDGRL